jgi:hypothetical protein
MLWTDPKVRPNTQTISSGYKGLGVVDQYVDDLSMPEADYRFKNLRKFEKALAEWTEYKDRVVAPTTLAPIGFEEFLNAKPVAGRRFSVTKVNTRYENTGEKRWRIYIKDGNTKARNEMTYFVPKTSFSETQAWRIGRTICDILTRWPHAIPAKWKQMDHALQLDRAIQKCFPKRYSVPTFTIPTAMHVLKQGQVEYQ